MKATEPTVSRVDAAYAVFLAVWLVPTLLGPGVLSRPFGDSFFVMYFSIAVTFLALPVALVGTTLALIGREEWPLLALAPLSIGSSLTWHFESWHLEPPILEAVHVLFMVATVASGFSWLRRRRSRWVESHPSGVPAL